MKKGLLIIIGVLFILNSLTIINLNKKVDSIKIPKQTNYDTKISKLEEKNNNKIDNLEKKISKLEKENTKLEKEYNNLKKENETLKLNINNVDKKYYDNITKSMSYVELKLRLNGNIK